MADPIIALSDGRPGHFSATAGMLEALAALTAAEVVRLEVRLRAKALRPLLATALRLVARLPAGRRAGAARRALALGYRADRPWPARAEAVVSTGGDTLYANALLARATGARNLFCGSLRGVDPGEFTRVVTNRSADDPHAIPTAVVLETAPMPKPPPRPAPAGADRPPLVAVLVGGDGGGYAWREADWRALAATLEAADRAGLRLLLTTSRRTTPAAEALLAEAAAGWRHLERAVFWHRRPEKTVADFLARADLILVTADSATMITEAVLAGRPVLLLAPAEARPPARYRRFLDQLVADGRAAMLEPGAGIPDPASAGWFRPIPVHPVDELARALAPLWARP